MRERARAAEKRTLFTGVVLASFLLVVASIGAASAEASLTKTPAAELAPAPALTRALTPEEPSVFSLGLDRLADVAPRPALFTGDEVAGAFDAPRASAHAGRFHPLAAVSLLYKNGAEPPLVSADPLRFQKTRIGFFDFLGSRIVGVERGVSLDLHWGCGDFSCRFSEGIGIWLSQDPLGDKDSPNLYGFVGARPHEFTDPMGTCLGLDNVPCLDYLAEVPSFLGQTAKDTAKVAAAGAAGVAVGAAVVAAAAVSAPVVVAGAAAAAITYGVVKATEAGINRWGAGQSVTRSAVGGVGDVTGASALVAGVADRDIATGRKLNLTHDQKIKALQGGAFALGAIYGGGKAAETLDFSGLSEAVGRGLNEGLKVPRGPTGNVYSVAFETAIPKRGIGTRDSHFQAANEAALRAQSDPEVADAFASLGIAIPVDSGGAVMGRSPAGWTWHHVTEQPGVMRLVPRGQHQGKMWQDVLHPKMDGRRVGGFKLWGADY